MPPGLRPAQRAFLERLADAVAGDERIAALFLGGSYASGGADAFSDLDIYLMTTDADFDEVREERYALLHRVGEAVFLQEHSFFGFLLMLYIYADGVNGEIALAPARDLDSVHAGPHRVLLDRGGLLKDHSRELRIDTGTRERALHDALTWFWYYRLHLDVALARGHLWTAHSYLERCRERCLQLAWMRARPDSWPGDHEKAERNVDAHTLERLAPTVVSLGEEAIAEAATSLSGLHRELGAELTKLFGGSYPERLATTVERLTPSVS